MSSSHITVARQEPSPKIDTYTPLDLRLISYIVYYYFLSSQEKGGHFEFWHYPHFKHSLVFFNRSKIEIKDDVRYVVSTNDDGWTSTFNSNALTAKQEVVKGPFDIIGVVFNPLGINHFAPSPLSLQHPGLHSKDTGNLLSLELDEVFKIAALTDRVKVLDEIFCKALKDFKQHVLEKAINEVVTRKGNVELNQLSAQFKVSRRTLLRLFKQHLGCSFREFKAVVKFRVALERSAKEPGINKLGDLAYLANYYDQSDFIRDFRTKTNETPGKALKLIAAVADNLFWKVKQ